MINVKEFLSSINTEFGTYALVTYDNKKEAVLFNKYNFGDGDWFLESPCELYKIAEGTEAITKFIKEDIIEDLEDGVNAEDFIKTYIYPMIINEVLYEIKNFQCMPYLPEFVDEIKFINDIECLEFLIEQIK